MSKAWYLLAVVPLVASAVVLPLVSASFDEVRVIQRVSVPGEHTLKLAPGNYVVYRESKTADAETPFSVRCTAQAGDGSLLQLETGGARYTYETDVHKGESIYKLSIEEAASVQLTCQSEPPGVLSIAHGVELGSWIFSGVLSIAGSFGVLAAGGIFTLIFIKRRKARGLPA